MTRESKLHKDKSFEVCIARGLTETDRKPLLEAIQLQEEASAKKVIEFGLFFVHEMATKTKPTEIL
jgi:hypothetical protein